MEHAPIHPETLAFYATMVRLARRSLLVAVVGVLTGAVVAVVVAAVF